jgi:hypothetical protein
MVSVDDIFPSAKVRTTFDRLPGGGYVYALPDEAVRVELRYLRRERGQVIGEVDVQCDWPGARRHEGSLSCADLNLSSQPARRGLAKYCAERAKTRDEDFDWLGVIDAACLLTIRAERGGDDVIVLDDAPEVVERDVDVYGLKVPTDAASMLIAHGDSLKSMTLLLVLGTLAQRGLRTLLLDWEWTADRHKARKRRLFGSDRLAGLHYLRCRAPLVLEADRIRRFCDANRVDFVGVDSVGLACDGKLIDDDVAVRFHRALGLLPPAMCAAHVPKSAIQADPKADPIGPFGSVFFSNLCRASWLVKKQPGANENIVTIGLFPQKQNDGERQGSVGLEFTFGPTISVRSVDLADVDGLADKLPLARRIAHVLQHGPLTLVQIAERLDAKVDSVTKAVNRAERTFTRLTNMPDGVHRIALVERRIA